MAAGDEGPEPNGGSDGAGGGDRTPTGLTTLRIFVPLRLSPPAAMVRGAVRGLDYPFALSAALRKRG